MIGNTRHKLIKIIGSDLRRHSQWPILLLITVLISAILVVITTHQTRLLTDEREQVMIEKNSLDIEWRNLILEEHSLGDQSGIERIATKKLQMQYINQLQENIVLKQ